MTQSMKRRQSVILGLVVATALSLTAFGLIRVGAREGLWTETIEVTASFAEAHDVVPGTSVRMRGIEAGRVVAVEYPNHDGAGAAVTVRMKIDAKLGDRLYSDATARIHSTSLLGARVIAIAPGSSGSGPLVDGRIAGQDTPDLAAAAAKLTATADKFGTTADEATLLLRDARSGKGSIGKLLADDGLYQDLTGLAKESRTVMKRAETAVGLVEKKAEDVDRFVQDGRDTLRSVKQGTDAVQRMPIIRGYVENATAILIRPNCKKEDLVFAATDLFEPNTAILTEVGQQRLKQTGDWLLGIKNDKAEVVVVAMCDPKDNTMKPEFAAELTRKQAEAVVASLKNQGVHKTGWWSRRTITPLGIGQGPSPVVEAKPLPASHVQIILFMPQ